MASARTRKKGTSRKREAKADLASFSADIAGKRQQPEPKRPVLRPRVVEQRVDSVVMLVMLRRRHRRRVQIDMRRRRAAAGLSLLLCVGLVLAGASGWWARDNVVGASPWPTLAQLPILPVDRNSVVFASNGVSMGIVPAERFSIPISLRQAGPWMAKAVVSIEDRRFYRHAGFDSVGVARAAQRNLQAGRIVEGGSTITQQTVRLLFAEISRERTFARKAREISLAHELEQRWSKQRILLNYLNRAYFGHKAYGVQAAAFTYFSVPASRLNLEQSALLAGLVQQPSAFDPFTNPAAALERRNQVLRAMHRDGAIDFDQMHEALQTKIDLWPSNRFAIKHFPHFFDHVERELVAVAGNQHARYGGLRVTTTLDPKVQAYAQQAIDSTLNWAGDPAAAVVVLDTESGAIRAMAQSSQYADSRFNLATQGRRQTGSSAKTWALSALVRRGVDPWKVSYVSEPLTVKPFGSIDWWKITTYDHSYVGKISVGKATLRSDNSVFAQLTMDLGPADVADMAADLGIATELERV